MKSLLLGALAMGSLVACSTAAVDRSAPNTDPLEQNQNIPDLNQGGGGGGTITSEPIGTLSGRVFAPNGRLPIPGALVYLTTTKPAAIPEKTYCDKCVDTGAGQNGTLSKTDGRFELKAYATGTHYLVTQKGQFRRVRKVEVSRGAVTVAEEDTTFPSRTSGDDTAPLMAVVAATSDGFDRIEQSLEKMGITQYDIIDADNADGFVKSAARMQKYHVVFLPCGAGGIGTCGNARMAAANTKSALNSFVASGGKLYVTDFSYEYVNQAWPGYLQWSERDSFFSGNGRGRACTNTPWSGTPRFEDTGLNSWVKQREVSGTGNLTLEGNYTTLAGVNTVSGKDENGAAAQVTPKIWASGKNGTNFIPTTVSFQDTCGRVLFSSYHTENDGEAGTSTTLHAQEASLLYVLLEVNACVGAQPTVN